MEVKGSVLVTKLEYTFKNDTLFKMLFVKYPDLLKRLIAALLAMSKFGNTTAIMEWDGSNGSEKQ